MPNYSRERRDKDVEAGRCPVCRKPNDNTNYVWCSGCRAKQNQYNATHRASNPQSRRTYMVQLDQIEPEELKRVLVSRWGYKVLMVKRLGGAQAGNQYTKRRAAGL